MYALKRSEANCFRISQCPVPPLIHNELQGAFIYLRFLVQFEQERTTNRPTPTHTNFLPEVTS